MAGLHYSDILSTIALVISVGGAAFAAFRDRPRLKVTSTFLEEDEYGPAQIHVAILNKGRRPVILRLLGGTLEGGGSSGTYFDHEKGGLRLGEHERIDRYLKQEDTASFDPERAGPDPPFERMWVEDSLGNRHSIPRSHEYIQKLWTADAP